MVRVDLEDGGWAELREPSSLTNGQRRPIVIASERYLQQELDPELVRAIQQAIARNDEERLKELTVAIGLGVDDSKTLKVAEVALVVLIESWSLKLPLPDSAPVLDDDGIVIGSHVFDDVPAFDYDRLMRAAGVMLPSLRWSPGEGSRPTKPSAPQARRRGLAGSSKASPRKSGASTKR